MRGLVLIIPDVVALAACVYAVAADLRTLRVPNRLTGPLLVTALALSLAIGVYVNDAAGALAWGLASLLGAVVGLFVFGIPAALGLVGMGDVKLAIAIGALLRWPLALPFVLYVALAGGLVALGYAIARRRVGAVARNIVRRGDGALHRMPYALAIAIGCTWAVLSRHVEWLRLL